MDARAKRKFANKKFKKRSTAKSFKSEVSEISLGIPKFDGIESLYLSPLTQQILDCRIGIDITLQEPWIFIEKEKILENLELHENSSEFLPLKDEIHSYPDDKILIGCYGHKQDQAEEFMVCTTPYSAQQTIDAVLAQEAEQHKKIVESIVKTCGTWNSLGSEIEVDECMRLSLRKPFVVNLVSEGNTFCIPYKFRFRFVADSPDGYVELISPRQTFKNVFRKRISLQIQCSALKTSVVTQTVIEPVINKSTMCPTKMEPKKLAKNAIENFFAKIDEALLFDIMETNFFMDLCNEDYYFQNAVKMHIFKFPLCILSFQDIFTCRGKKVSCVSWNAMKSGLIAVSYMKEPCSLIVGEDTRSNQGDTLAEDHLILVWSYTDIIKPQLYLHCSREVAVVSFCSYNANIVVGGCDNGQIVVWDISGRMEQGEELKVLTRQEQENQLILEKYMRWMKMPPDVQHVYPVIYSCIEQAHLSPVSYIEWLPPDECITKNGHFKKCDRNVQHMQFLSCSKESGRIEFWDIGVPEDATGEVKKRRTARLNQVPSALRKDISPLKALAKNFKPEFRVWVSNPDTRQPLIISMLHEKKFNINYKALNPETEDSIYKRTLFEFVPNKINDTVSEQKFICATAFGELVTLEWEGHDYDQGCKVNSNTASVCRTRTYHDGPIVVCMESPIIKNLLLTVGGRVFAIWNARDLKEPLFWRKAAHRYVTGTWLTTHAFQFSLIRHNSFKEIWDLMEDSKNALKVIKTKGRASHSIYNDFRRTHTKKGTFVETNVAGEVHIYSVAENYNSIKKEEIDAVINYLDNLTLNSTILMNWIDSIKVKFSAAKCLAGEEEAAAAAVLLDNQEAAVDDSAARKSKKSIHLETNKWQAKEEAFMRNVLLANKHLKIDQITKSSVLIKQAEAMRKKNSKKLAEQIRMKDKKMQGWRMVLLPEHDFMKPGDRITVSFSKDMAQYMKQSYIENYKDIEQPTMNFIRTHRYKYMYDWAELLSRALASWKAPPLQTEDPAIDPLDFRQTLTRVSG